VGNVDNMKTTFSSLGDLLGGYTVEQTKQRRISREWQDYAYRLAIELDDKKNLSLYMRLCKETKREILESARSFVKDALTARSKPKLFMWKVKQIKNEN
jgi:hypothetical protein